MREIVSPLGGFATPFGQRHDPFGVLGLSPEYVADFESNRFRANGANTTLAAAVTHTRASTATYVDSTGTLRTAAINEPRIGHHVWNGSAWVNEGLLHESEARTNLLHTTDALVTQSVTVAAVPHTLHFSGTGTVTLSGASTAGPLVGTGAGENNRVTLTFTPTAGTLTLTVSGTVANAQFEVGPTLSSYIPNLAASGSVTRAADVLTIPAANLPWNPLAVSIQMDGLVTYADEDSFNTSIMFQWQQNTSNKIQLAIDTNGASTGELNFLTGATTSSVAKAFVTPDLTPGVLVPFISAGRVGSNFVQVALNGTAGTALATPVALPDLSATDLKLGFDYMGTIRTFRVWANDIGDAGIEEASS